MDKKDQFLHLIEKWEFSKHLNDAARKGLKNSVKIIHYGAGEEIIKKDLPGHIFWIIAKGKASARVMNNKGEQVILETMEPGDFFGEIALLYLTPRSVDVIAEEDVELFMLSQEDFEKYILSSKELEKVLKEFARKRLDIRDRMVKEDNRDNEGLLHRLKSLFVKNK